MNLSFITDSGNFSFFDDDSSRTTTMMDLKWKSVDNNNTSSKNGGGESPTKNKRANTMDGLQDETTMASTTSASTV